MPKQTHWSILLLLCSLLFIGKIVTDDDDDTVQLPVISLTLSSLSQVKGLTGQPFTANCRINEAQFSNENKNYTINFYQTDKTGTKPLLIGKHEVFAPTVQHPNGRHLFTRVNQAKLGSLVRSGVNFAYPTFDLVVSPKDQENADDHKTRFWCELTDESIENSAAATRRLMKLASYVSNVVEKGAI